MFRGYKPSDFPFKLHKPLGIEKPNFNYLHVKTSIQFSRRLFLKKIWKALQTYVLFFWSVCFCLVVRKFVKPAEEWRYCYRPPRPTEKAGNNLELRPNTTASHMDTQTGSRKFSCFWSSGSLQYHPALEVYIEGVPGRYSCVTHVILGVYFKMILIFYPAKKKKDWSFKVKSKSVVQFIVFKIGRLICRLLDLYLGYKDRQQHYD